VRRSVAIARGVQALRRLEMRILVMPEIEHGLADE
jgi:hypothetical protein